MVLQEKESFRTTSEDSFHLTGEKAQPKDMVVLKIQMYYSLIKDWLQGLITDIWGGRSSTRMTKMILSSGGTMSSQGEKVDEVTIKAYKDMQRNKVIKAMIF